MHSWIRPVALLGLSGTLLLPGSIVEATTKSKSTQQDVQLIAQNDSTSKLTKEQALSIASEFVKEWSSMKPVLSDNSFESNEDTDLPPIWSFTWESSDNNVRRNSFYLQIDINSNTGELYNYHISYPSLLETKGKEPISLKQAQRVAEAFLRKHASKKLSSISLNSNPISDDRTPLTSSKYFFSYIRQVNGIPFPDDYMRVVVSPNGTIVSYSFNWSEDLILPPDTKKISLEEATKIFKESPFLTLIYNVPYRKETEIIEPQLVYDYETSLAIDAVTGQSVEKPSESIPDVSNKHIPVTEKPLAPLHNGPPLTQTQAEELAKKALQLKDWKVTQVSYQEKNTNKRALWYLSFEKNAQKESSGGIEINLDAMTGNVLTYYSQKNVSQEGSKKVPLSPEKLQKIALDTVQRLAPYQAETLYLDRVKNYHEPEMRDVMESTFHFQRYIHGIKVFSEIAELTLDQQTGELLSFQSTAFHDFPEKLPTHLTLEEAKEKWLQELEVKLTYVMNQKENSGKKQQTAAPSSLTLVYTLQPFNKGSYTLDAVTGKWINPSTNKLVELSRTEPGDLNKLPADTQKALRIMYEYNAIGLINEEIKPKEPIKRGEMIKMLVATINNGYYDDDDKYSFQKASFTDVPTNSTYFGVVEYALELGFISPSKNKVLQPEETITRAELADLFTRALGYHSLAQLPNLFVSPTTDTASSKKKGSISIVTALGIMETTNQSFKPDASITREEAAISFLKFLEVYNKRGAEEPLLFQSRH